jgi:hypothetical protein
MTPPIPSKAVTFYADVHLGRYCFHSIGLIYRRGVVGGLRGGTQANALFLVLLRERDYVLSERDGLQYQDLLYTSNFTIATRISRNDSFRLQALYLFRFHAQNFRQDLVRMLS